MSARENHDLTTKGFNVLHPVMAKFIGKNLKLKYKGLWWSKVLESLGNNGNEVPATGEDETLLNSLDIANCIRVLERRWKDDFQSHIFNCSIRGRDKSCHTWIKELMGVRNALAHASLNDISLHDAERALDTMMLVCDELYPSKTKDIKVYYDKIREKSLNNQGIAEENVEYIYPIQTPVALKDNENGVNLFRLINTDWVTPTGASRKITFGKKTMVYPVYRVSLDELFYNDQNDRIATWISKYKAENGDDSIKNLTVDKEQYNDVIEEFIVNSNPEAIKKTQINIDAVDQREPGVVLSDGRIVDGNRRYTCLRRLQREKGTPYFFETVILDIDINEDKKQIKLLELALQHGEEKKVDYDLVDFAIGTYTDITKTELVTIEEYAESSNESISDVKKRLLIAGIICEFLDYIKLSDRYYIARDLQIYSLIEEMLSPLNSLKDDTEKSTLKTIAFNNALIKAVPDNRKFIRDIKTIVKSNLRSEFFSRELEVNNRIHECFDPYPVSSKDDIDLFAKNNEKIADELKLLIEEFLQKLRKSAIKAKPIDNVNKCISLLAEIDFNLISTLSEDEKQALVNTLEALDSKVKEVIDNI